jgi:hypothetical protein
MDLVKKIANLAKAIFNNNSKSLAKANAIGIIQKKSIMK